MIAGEFKYYEDLPIHPYEGDRVRTIKAIYRALIRSGLPASEASGVSRDIFHKRIDKVIDVLTIYGLTFFTTSEHFCRDCEKTHGPLLVINGFPIAPIY